MTLHGLPMQICHVSQFVNHVVVSSTSSTASIINRDSHSVLISLSLSIFSLSFPSSYFHFLGFQSCCPLAVSISVYVLVGTFSQNLNLVLFFCVVVCSFIESFLRCSCILVVFVINLFLSLVFGLSCQR